MALVYYPDNRPGIARRRCGSGFTYLAPDGTTIARGAERRRLEAMAVPPAYENVWMSPKANGHLMATGTDARARKQYRYHPEWSAEKSLLKYDGLAAFGRALPQIRAAVARDLRRAPGSEAFALAAAALLIDETAIRVGNAQYAAQNGSYGATTLTRRHLRLTPKGALMLSWVAKGGIRARRTITSRRLMRALQAARDLPGQELFTWIDEEGATRRIDSAALNAYLGEIGEGPFTAKVFRTWAGSVAALEAHAADPQITLAGLSQAAAARLANTPSVARNSYIHPKVLGLVGAEPVAIGPAPEGLSAHEGALLALIGD